MNKYNRIFNFAAGPAMLPTEVLESAKDELMNYKNSGMSVMEISHRSSLFNEIIKDAENNLRKLLNIPTNYKVGESLQTLSTEDTIQINSTYKDDVVFGTLQLGGRGSLQTWDHRNSGYNWDITPYQEYQNNLLK